MNIRNLMKEYSIEINDVRWYLANSLSYSLSEMSKDLNELTKYIESGQLESEMYNMEENYITEMQDLADRDKIDEVDIREVFNKVELLKRDRYKSN